MFIEIVLEMFMYIYIYICIFVDIHVYMFIHGYAYTYMYIYIYIIYTYVNLYTLMSHVFMSSLGYFTSTLEIPPAARMVTAWWCPKGGRVSLLARQSAMTTIYIIYIYMWYMNI